MRRCRGRRMRRSRGRRRRSNSPTEPSHMDEEEMYNSKSVYICIYLYISVKSVYIGMCIYTVY